MPMCSCVLVLLVVIVAIASLTFFRDFSLLGSEQAHLQTWQEGCIEPPLCSSPRLSWMQRLRCTIRAVPFDPRSVAYRAYARRRLYKLGQQLVKGQYVLKPLLQTVTHKLNHMHEPLVLHLAGDNGVGKTRTAEVISLAMGQRCGNSDCSIGDSTLVLAGTSYDGMGLESFRNLVVPAICWHAARYPHNGVLIFNDLSALEPDKVRLLLPLLGRGGNFPEFPKVDLSRLIVIITTDFGNEGRTRGKSLAEMQVFINEEFQELYTKRSTSFIRAFPFLPISLETASDIVRMAVQGLSCSCGQVLSISDEAVLWLVEKVKPRLVAENGRAVVEEVTQSVVPLLDRFDGSCNGGSVLSVNVNGELVLLP